MSYYEPYEYNLSTYFINPQGAPMPKQISENKRNMILNGNLSQAILMLAVPVMINSFIQSMYNLTDTFWLGRIGTENPVSYTHLDVYKRQGLRYL